MCACLCVRACLRAVDSERLNVTARQQSLRGEKREKCCKGRKGDDSFLMKVYQAVEEKRKKKKERRRPQVLRDRFEYQMYINARCC